MAQPHESRVYSDLAHFYDRVFGRAFVDSEHEVIESLGLRPGHQVLEVGVGTGIALEAYPPYVRVLGIDPSNDMLEHARAKTRDNNWPHIELRQGDALNLDLPENSFDFVCAFHVVTVVPNPLKMMSEMYRVCKPGGKIVILNHFRSDNPVLGFLTGIANPLTKHLGWTTRLRFRDMLNGERIVVERQGKASLLHTVVVASKIAD
jgi:phosphatidylethanolamine/phosphatidyl-N-methylethanolamine N-methyltransferase